MLRTSLRGQGWPTASPVGAGLLTGAQRGRNWPWSVQPVLMTQRLPDVTSRRGCFALGFACTEYNRSEDGFLYLPRHARRQQLCMPPSGLLHIHHSWPPSLSKEGVNSKSRHETARGRAVRTGQGPGPHLLSPPSQGGADVPVRPRSPEGTSEHRAEKPFSHKSLASVGRSQALKEIFEERQLLLWGLARLSHFSVLRTGLSPWGLLKSCQVVAKYVLCWGEKGH